MGFQMLIVTVGWLMYDITGSSVQLGLVGLSTAVPAILLNLFGGVVADKVNPKRLIMIVQSLNAVAVGTLATLTLLELVQPWHIMVNAFIMGALGAFDQPSRQAIFPHLIDRRGDDERRGDELHDLAGQQNSWSRHSRGAHSLGWSVFDAVYRYRRIHNLRDFPNRHTHAQHPAVPLGNLLQRPAGWPVIRAEASHLRLSAGHDLLQQLLRPVLHLPAAHIPKGHPGSWADGSRLPPRHERNRGSDGDADSGVIARLSRTRALCSLAAQLPLER